jgi:ABC-type multidrug transport system ATPase subunit
MRLHEVGYRYGRRGAWVLRDVTVGIEPGEIVVVRGGNGAGKSTLLSLFAGVLRPVQGKVDDQPARIGWVPERFPTEQPFTVGRYLSTMAQLRGGTAATVERWISRLGLAPLRREKLSALSKGTAQKVGLAQALLVPPDLLLLDEPWEGLDIDTRELVPDILDEVLHDGGAVLVSDHSGDTGHLPGVIEWAVVDGNVAVVRPGKRSEDKRTEAEA